MAREDNGYDGRLRAPITIMRRGRHARRHRERGSAGVSAPLLRGGMLIPDVVVVSYSAARALRHGARLHPEQPRLRGIGAGIDFRLARCISRTRARRYETSPWRRCAGRATCRQFPPMRLRNLPSSSIGWARLDIETRRCRRDGRRGRARRLCFAERAFGREAACARRGPSVAGALL